MFIHILSYFIIANRDTVGDLCNLSSQNLYKIQWDLKWDFDLGTWCPKCRFLAKLIYWLIKFLMSFQFVKEYKFTSQENRKQTVVCTTVHRLSTHVIIPTSKMSVCVCVCVCGFRYIYVQAQMHIIICKCNKSTLFSITIANIWFIGICLDGKKICQKENHRFIIVYYFQNKTKKFKEKNQ